MSTQSRSFWSTMPGLVTGVAGILTALVGLGTLLVQLGVIGGNGGDSSPKPGPGATFIVSPTSLDLTADDKTGSVTVENTGATALSVQQPALSGSGKDQFSVSSRCGQLPAGDSCTVTVTFKGLLDASAVLTIRASGGASPKDVALEGKLL